MVRSGIVTNVDVISNSGVIQDDRGREFFFSIYECCENELPRLYSTVTFVKDPDYKTTNVAALIKPSKVFKGFAA